MHLDSFSQCLTDGFDFMEVDQEEMYTTPISKAIDCSANGLAQF